jgi:mannose-1-phosphate guanylyltransferase
MKKNNPSCIIMAGGKGTRFWPLSRNKRPKQLLPLVDKKSLLENTIDRIKGLFSNIDIHVVTGRDIAPFIKKTLSSYKKVNIIEEPMGRNTAPCIGYMAFKLSHYKGPDNVMVIMPADHLINNKKRFIELLKLGISTASKENKLVTIGIKPRSPHTGYGYIEKSSRLKGTQYKIFSVKKFHEKPKLENAKKYYSSDRYLWNSGIFIVKAGIIKQSIKDHMPELYYGLNEISKSFGKKDESSKFRQKFATLPAESIDYGVIEKLDQILTIESDIDWNDIGSWNSFSEIFKTASTGYSNTNSLISMNSNNTILHISDKKKLVVTLGIQDLIVVDTPDVLFISNKDDDQKVKDIVEKIKQKNMKAYL